MEIKNCNNNIQMHLHAHAKSARELITYVKDRLGHDRRYSIDSTKSKTEINYKLYDSFETGIRKTVDWYLENSDWWRSVVDGSYNEWINFQYSR